MSKWKRYAVVTGLAVLFCGFVSIRSVCAQQVDSPQYQSWARQKVGTSVTYVAQVNGGPMQITETAVYTLTEVTPEKVTVQVVTKMDVGGIGRPGQPLQQTISFPAKVDKGQEYAPPDFNGTVKESGKETIEAGGKKYDCRVFEFSGQSIDTGNRGDSTAHAMTGKIWRNDEIPGGEAKMQMDINMNQMTMKLTSTLSSIDAK